VTALEFGKRLGVGIEVKNGEIPQLHLELTPIAPPGEFNAPTPANLLASRSCYILD
jgi:hypothetical protein